MIVCKFGGSSTTTAKALQNIERISHKKCRKIFVFSALGKASENDEKITDLLIDFCVATNNEEKNKIIKKIKLKFDKLINLTHVNIEFSAIFKNISKTKNKNYIISRGEYLTSQIMAQFLGIKFVPAEQIFCLRNDEVDFDLTKKKIEKFLARYGRICTGGFYGYDVETKKIVLFERGGGDISGAILAKCLNAKVYENFTDVSGVKMANPKYVPTAKTIKKLSYKQMKILSQCDGKVLHERVCEMLDGTKTKAIVANTFSPNDCKTCIDSKHHKAKFVCFRYIGDMAEVLKAVGEKKETILCKKTDLKQTLLQEYHKFDRR